MGPAFSRRSPRRRRPGRRRSRQCFARRSSATRLIYCGAAAHLTWYAARAAHHGIAMDSKPGKAKEGPQRLSSVATAIELLKAFSEDEVEIGISTLAKRLGVAKSTAHRLATTLMSENMLEQDRATGKYRLGIALFRLGTLVRRRMNVSEVARPHLFSLREKTNETVHLAILDGTEIMYVYFLESTQAVRMRSDLGRRKPAYCTAEGQAILAFRPPEMVQAVIRKGLAPRTPQTLTDPDGLLKALETVRQKGCAVEDEESEIGV